MYWTLELAYHLEDAPWPATRDELIDYAIRSGAPLEVIENLQQMEDEGEVYEGIEEIWPDYPRKDDFLFNEDEYWAAGKPRLLVFCPLQQKVLRESRAKPFYFFDKALFFHNLYVVKNPIFLRADLLSA